MEMTWEDAQRTCEQTPESYLVTIEGKMEDEFLLATMRSLSARQFWIGLNDREKESLHEWIDGTEEVYRNLVLSSDNKEKVLDCVMSKEYGWNTEKCGNKAAFVCEYRPCKCSF